MSRKANSAKAEEDPRLTELRREDIKLIQTLLGNYDLSHAKRAALVLMDYMDWSSAMQARVEQNALRVVKFRELPAECRLPGLTWRELLAGIDGVLGAGRTVDKCTLLFKVHYPGLDCISIDQWMPLVEAHFSPRRRSEQIDFCEVFRGHLAAFREGDDASGGSPNDLTPAALSQIITRDPQLKRCFQVRFSALVDELSLALTREPRTYFSLSAAEVR